MIKSSGMLKRRCGKISQSIEIFNDLLTRDPSNVEMMKQLARSTSLMGQHSEAIKIYNMALNYANSDWDLHFRKGLCFKALEQYSQAEAAFFDSLRFQTTVSALQALGKIYILQNRFEDARSLYESAFQQYPEQPEFIVALGLLYVRSGDYENAFKFVKCALSTGSCNGETMELSSDIMQDALSMRFNLGGTDMDLLLQNYRLALMTDNQDAELWSNIGIALHMKSLSKASLASISSLKQALYLAPLRWTIAYNLGLAHLQLGQFVSAFVFLSLAGSLNRNDVDILERIQFTVAKIINTK
ncbi:hypothetical protein BC830DRAFT_1108994 [Chytriomyces sp. MP71]|nr:hypothetical protein BC830DRAFT_1108994 [Chytriomyces sp. MP71]